MGDKKGVCTGYLSQIHKNLSRPCYIKGFIKDSQFRLPSSPSIPMIMVGTGSGIAPFIGFIEEKEHVGSAKYGEFELYFGCKYKEKDFIYRKDLQRWKDKGILNGLHLAFSMDQEEKMYVQDLMRRDSERLYELITRQKAVVSVCGVLKMGEEVRKVVLEIVRSKSYLAEMERTGRFAIGVWE
eukprot:TRINITY_DN12711_c0_g1_i1.p1 TRINITY_DN12711_c0_g1~~TRINITY_DN12711_c0_g1_i1.p1  ORF type:complete len:183 (+),score=35.22 TRINITY_DN12711_c0_g1_i1:1373-1921(+)